MLLVQHNIVKPKPVSRNLIGRDAKNALPTSNIENAEWLNIAGLSWLLFED